MPVKLYWGPPGSFKTASAVWDDVTACAKDGRVIVTNVRGLTDETVSSHLQGVEIKPGFRVMQFEQGNPAKTDMLRRWWWWAPFGAYFILDEVQALYPPFWASKQLREMDCPDSCRRNWPSGEPMPKEMELAFDMHRHGNWDFTFTTPSIKKVRPEIRAAAEWAYKHKNLEFTGFYRGRFLESMHSAEDNGNPSDIYSSRVRKVPPYVFKLYASTATNKHQDSKAGVSIFKSPKFLLLASVVVCAVGFVATRPIPEVFRPRAPKTPVSEAAIPPAQAPFAGQRLEGLWIDEPADAVLTDLPVSNRETPTKKDQRDPARVYPSQTWRLLGVIVKKDGNGLAMLASGSSRRRVDASACKPVDKLTEWECIVDGELVARWTGADPIGAALGNIDKPG